jgi:hypothetical protein
METECLNCSRTQTITDSSRYHDEFGPYTFCEKCGSSYDINEDNEAKEETK